MTEKMLERSGAENQEWQETLRKDPCALCGGPGGSIDHIVPRATGGPNSWDNLSGCCHDCNTAKSANQLLHHLVLTPRHQADSRAGTAWVDGLRLATANLRGSLGRLHAKHGPMERVLDRLLERHPEAEGALVYRRGNRKGRGIRHTLKLRPGAGDAGAICRRRKGDGDATRGEFHRWRRIGHGQKPKSSTGKDEVHPAVLDEEPGRTNLHRWRAVGPAGTELHHRSYAGTAAEAVAAVRTALPGRQVMLCPRTRRGRELAIQAATIIDRTTVTGYQVWVTEEHGVRQAWHIHWHNKYERRSRVTGCATATAAVARVRKRQPNHAIRIVTSTPKGAIEAARLTSEDNVVLRDCLVEGQQSPIARNHAEDFAQSEKERAASNETPGDRSTPAG